MSLHQKGSSHGCSNLEVTHKSDYNGSIAHLLKLILPNIQNKNNVFKYNIGIVASMPLLHVISVQMGKETHVGLDKIPACFAWYTMV